MSLTLFHALAETPMGPVLVVASDRGLVASTLPGCDWPADLDRIAARHPGCELAESVDRLRPYLDALAAYFDGTPFPADLPLDLDGAPFQAAAWEAMRSIPQGQVITYAELAARAGSPNASRASGTACGSNPVPLFVPCHRVVASNGGLGGFGGGLEMKKLLLRREGVEGY